MKYLMLLNAGYFFYSSLKYADVNDVYFATMLVVANVWIVGFFILFILDSKEVKE